MKMKRDYIPLIDVNLDAVLEGLVEYTQGMSFEEVLQQLDEIITELDQKLMWYRILRKGLESQIGTYEQKWEDQYNREMVQ